MKKLGFLLIGIFLIGFVLAVNTEVYDYQGANSRYKVNYSIFEARNISGTQYVCVSGNCIKFWNQTTDSSWVSNWTAFNSSWGSTFNSTVNDSINNYILSSNNSNNNYIVSANNTLAGWVDNFFLRFTEIVDQVGNWTLDKVNYYTQSQVNDINTSMNNYVNVQNGSLVNYISVVNTSMNNSVKTLWSYVDAQNTSQTNDMNSRNTSITNSISTNNNSVTNALNTKLNINQWNATNTSYYLDTNPKGFYNSTSNIGNWTGDKSSYTLLSVLNNGSYLNYPWNATNTSYLTSETLWNANYSTFLNHISWSNIINGSIWSWVMNGTIAKSSELNNGSYLNYAWNATNTSYVPYTGANNNINLGNNSVTFYNGATIGIGPLSSGTWIDLPTSGPSGIGTGGSGVNPWVAYASSPGNWFSDAASGDIAYRNTLGKLLFGNSAGNSAMAISYNKVGIGTNFPNETLSVVGNMSVSSQLQMSGNINMSSNKNITFNGNGNQIWSNVTCLQLKGSTVTMLIC